MIEPMISVIVPIYNVEHYLDRCIQSIVDQTYRNLEIILVDDGSPDGSPEICDLWAKRDSRIKVIHKENGGLSSARNAGLDICDGVYIGFVDSDDWVEPDMYETLLRACLDNDSMLAVCGRYVVSGDEKIVDKCSVDSGVLEPTEFVSRMLIGDRCDASACDKLFYRSLWSDCRFPHGKIYEDVAVMYKPVLRANTVAIVGKPLYNYYRHSASITKSAFSPKLFDYPNNTRKMLNDITVSNPSLREYACWSHTKALQYVLAKIAKADWQTFCSYLPELKLLSKELRSLKTVWKKSCVFSIYDKKLCAISSVWYILRPIYCFKTAIKELIKNGH